MNGARQCALNARSHRNARLAVVSAPLESAGFRARSPSPRRRGLLLLVRSGMHLATHAASRRRWNRILIATVRSGVGQEKAFTSSAFRATEQSVPQPQILLARGRPLFLAQSVSLYRGHLRGAFPHPKNQPARAGRMSGFSDGRHVSQWSDHFVGSQRIAKRWLASDVLMPLIATAN